MNTDFVDSHQAAQPIWPYRLLLNGLMCALVLALGLLLLVAAAVATVLLTVVLFIGLCNFTLRSLWAACRASHA